MSFVVPGIAVADVPKYAWKTRQVKIDLNPPVINVLNEVFSADGGVRLVRLIVKQTNTETDGKEIDILITIDGVERLYDSSDIGQLIPNKDYSVSALGVLTANPVWTIDVADASTTIGVAQLLGYGTTVEGKPLEGHEIKVEIRLTNAAGTAQRLYAKATYETLEAV